MACKSFTLDSKRHTLSRRVPQAAIERIMGGVHVDTPDAEVRRDMAERCTKAGVMAMAMLGPICDYTVFCHRKNQELYRASMRVEKIYAEATIAGMQAALAEINEGSREPKQEG